MADGASEAFPPAHGVETTDPECVPVAVGRRVVVLANLDLTAEATPASTGAAAELAHALDGWDGPGLVVVAGNLLDLRRATDAGRAAQAALDAHRDLGRALRSFCGGDDHRVVYLPGVHDHVVDTDADAQRVLGALGVDIVDAVDLHMATGSGTRVVRVEAGTAAPPLLDRDDGGGSDGAPSSGDVATPTRRGALPVLAPDPSAEWQAGLDRLADPATTPRFLTSRLLYRRFARFAWWLLVPFVVALALRLPFVVTALNHLFSGHATPMHAINRAHQAAWGTRLGTAAIVFALLLLVLAAVLGLLARKAWHTLGAGELRPLFDDSLATAGATANDSARDSARSLCALGYAGVVVGTTLQPELTHLAPGFFASVGATGDVVEEHPGRLGLLPVFLACQQVAWIELETGAELHARLLLSRAELPGATFLERLAARGRPTETDAHTKVVAAWPTGASWPAAPDLGTLRRRSRRVRRWAAAAIAVAGAIDLLGAVTPPLRGRLHLVVEFLPYGATQAAGALVALAGIGLLVLARGVRRGQRRAHQIAMWVLAVTLVLHLVRGGDIEQSLFAAAVLAFLVVHRREFPAASDRPSLRSALVALGVGVVGITVLASVLVEVTLRFDLDMRSLPWWRAGQAVLERLVGLNGVRLPDRIDDFLSPSLAAIGVTLAVVALLLATRPLVDRRRSAGRAAEARARDIVRRHGEGTLDYFALRSDKQWFFHRDSLVAYAIYSGICLVSPDPIGPETEREQVWSAFRRFTDNRGWVVALMGASEQWLPIYRATGMHDIYIGDEAVVDVQRFSLAGGHMKGLRQAYNRIAKYGYTVAFHDPARLDRATAAQLTGLMSQSRRGEFERGFSMVLGRIFDPRDEGLLLCVVTGPDGTPAAMCQFVPARGIGGYSLDLMRRDRGEHPNGLVDFALVSTITHAADLGCHGLSLNFAALRSILEGERGDGPTQRVERWALKKMSSFLQIETLWRFNAKYGPDWLPRYVVYDTAEHLVPVVLAILRAESLSEVPVIGRMIAASDRRAHAGDDDAASGASLLPLPEQCPEQSPGEQSPGERSPVGPQRRSGT
ncbi:MAG TPA: phosphatidylglycerol lysyltransferase domain-containing protein [Acidimicrobiales bacterium]|nr:phosphatidylglycerol lysyltransferase domain-containing protein [Acidimicrobiales bacterium]